MKMRHFLAAVGAGVGDGAETVVRQVQIVRDLADGLPKTGNLGRAGVLGKIIQVGVMAFGNDQDMHGRLGIQIVKGEREFVVINRLRRNLTSQDFGEDVVGVVGHG